MRPWRGGQWSPDVESSAGTTELWWLAAYFTVVVAVTDVVNVRLGVELMTLVVLLPALVTRRGAAFARDWWVLLLGMLLWNLSGPVAALSPFPLHLDFMKNIDGAIFFGHQPVATVQHALMHPGRVGPLDYISGALYNLHVPEPYIAAYFLWRMNRAVFTQFVAAALSFLVLGFASFILFPAIPPWLASKEGHLPQVINGFGPVIRAHPLPFHGTPLFYLFGLSGDRVAAFPSEHAAFPMLELLFFWRLTGPTVRILLALWVLVVLCTIVYLGEHWVTDALAGYALAAATFLAVKALCAHRPVPSGSRAPSA